MKTLRFHPVCHIFPLMSAPDFEALKEDIRKHGQLEPILTYKGRIIDGRNRHLACKKLGIQPKYQEWDGRGSLVDFVLSMNLQRRHLTASQRTFVAVGILDYYEKLAKKRQATGRPGVRGGRSHVAKLPHGIAGKARDQVAKKSGISPRYVSDGKRLAKKAPDLYEQLGTGKVTLSQAKRELNKRERQNVPPLPSSKYRILYADPPWQYNDTRIGMSAYSSAEDHYPTMSLEELCSMGERVRDICEDNAVLFLWATSPILEDSFKVLRAWGFSYKSSFVWDKVLHNYGHYNSVRHEFLLIATKGSCTPDSPKLHDSVVSLKRSGVHSEKPERFRELIDELYTKGARLELFARKETPGWTCWGNEATQAGVLVLPDAPLTHSLPSGGR